MTGALPLDGIKVVEFAQLIAAPNAGMILADMGADVVKVEPCSGDAGRELQTAAFAGSSTSPTFMAFNRSKRSIAIDLKTTEGQEIAHRLIADADVVIENSRPGAMDRMGLGADAIRKQHPSIVYASVSGFGSTGPERDRRGVDMVIQAESGIMSVTGERDGRPMKVGFTVVDVAAGNILAQAILAALVRRLRTGDGDVVEVSLLDVALHLQSAPISEYLATGMVPERWGNAAPMTAPADLMRTKDGHLVVSAYLEDHWRRLCDVIGRPELVDDPMYRTKVDRVRNRDRLMSDLESSLSTRTSHEWLGALGSAGVVVGEVRTYDQVVMSAQVAATEAIVDVPRGDGTAFRTVRAPARFRAWSPPTAGAPPEIGEHSVAVLADVGYELEKIDQLVADGIIRSHSQHEPEGENT